MAPQREHSSKLPRLVRGDQLPYVEPPLPGPRARAYARTLAAVEAPGINTLHDGETAAVWQEALGANVLDVDGNRFIDLSAAFGVAAVGHRHPRVVAAIRHQSLRLVHGMGDVFAHPARIELARRLAALVPFPAKVYFAISGADAVEIALKTAQLATGREGVLAFTPAYHGVTLGALAVGSRPAFREPFARRLADCVARLPFAAAASEIRKVLARRREIGTCIVEPIVGREGVLVPPSGWLEELGTLCRRYGVTVVADEIFTGLGRAGALFVSLAERLEPDLLCCGKALGGGLPIAAVVGRAEVLDAWPASGEALHTATFVAHPLACAAALATLDVLDEERLVARAERLGSLVARRLHALAERFAIRGRGLLWGLEAPTAERAASWSRRLLEEGVLALAGGAHGTVLQLSPPLVITEPQLDYCLERLSALS